MRDPQTDQLLTEVRQAVANARAGGVTVRACIFDATVAAVDESARAWPSAEARRTADNACRAVEPPTAKAGPVPAALAPATDRAAVLSEAADDLAEFIALHGPTSRTVAGWRGAIGFLRRMAAEGQQPGAETRAPADRAAVLLEAAEVVDNPDGAFASNASDWGFIHARTAMAAKLRRLAAEAQQTTSVAASGARTNENAASLAASPSNRRALVHNAISDALSAAGDRVPFSVRAAATRGALAEIDGWQAGDTEKRP